MSNVVELKPRLKKRNGLARQISASLGPAQILLFSGVRYERWHEDEAKQTTDIADCKVGGGAGRSRRH